MKLTRLFLPAYLLLLTGYQQPAVADTFTADIRPDGSVIAATYNGDPLNVPLNYRLFQSEVRTGQQVNYKVWFGVVGYAPNGPQLVAWVGDESVYPNQDGSIGYWSTLTNTPNGGAYYYEPLNLQPGEVIIDNRDLYDLLNQPAAIHPIAGGPNHRLTVGSPTSLFQILDSYFAGRLSLGGLFDALIEWFAR